MRQRSCSCSGMSENELFSDLTATWALRVGGDNNKMASARGKLFCFCTQEQPDKKRHIIYTHHKEGKLSDQIAKYFPNLSSSLLSDKCKQ